MIAADKSADMAGEKRSKRRGHLVGGLLSSRAWVCR